MHLPVPELHASQDISEVSQSECVCMTLAHSQEVSVHLTGHVQVSHRQLTILKQLHLVCLYDVFSNDACPLVFYANLPLLIAKIVVATQDLDKILSTI